MATTRSKPQSSVLPSGESAQPQRVVIDAVMPEVEAGRYPAKRTAGERVEVTAHLFADGHDVLGAVVLYRQAGEREWREASMQEVVNDEWQGVFVAGTPGMMEYTVEGWVDHFETWRTDLERRVEAGWDVSSELLEGAGLVRSAAQRAKWPDVERFRWAADRMLDSALPEAERAQIALDASLAEQLALYPDRSNATRYRRTLELLVDRERARFGAWYEMFPRSAGTDPTRSATLREAAGRLPDIAAMGFDVLYLPPIHPIGAAHRKGRNNSLAAEPEDPGSPWAIGSPEGGHTAVHPDLGTLEDFDWFVAEARSHGLEIALDFALQCSPDHPWVREHPEWFRRRPDGSIKYAENPPKRYEDIYPLDFACEDWPALWEETRRVVEFWIAHGVLIFRVDNPHTKPYAFWEWLISEVRRAHPDVIFLAEAFTRPKRMAALAKRGFNQSYTYFTWRNSKQEIVDYFTELTHPPAIDFLRPNLFTNTPDILHAYLQTGGRAAFLVRLALAGTLGPSYGIYSGFELIEHEAVAAGSEEYRDSEKYEIKPRDWDTPGNIKPAITRLNELRRRLPALQYSHDVWFLPIENDQIVAFMKSAPAGGEHVLVVVNVDPRRAQEGWVGLPMESLGLSEDVPFVVHDALNDTRHTWRGRWNYVRLDPETMPAQVLVFEHQQAAAP